MTRVAIDPEIDHFRFPVRERPPQERDELVEDLRSVQRRLGCLTVAVMVMTLFWMITVAAVFGSLANYFDGDATFFGGSCIGAALLGFGFGWVARRRA